MVRRKLELHEKVVNESEGGDLGSFIKKFKDKEFICCSDKKTKNKYLLDEFRAIKKEHSDGLENAEGKKLWVYWTCPGCNYDWNYHNLVTFLSNKKN